MDAPTSGKGQPFHQTGTPEFVELPDDTRTFLEVVSETLTTAIRDTNHGSSDTDYGSMRYRQRSSSTPLKKDHPAAVSVSLTAAGCILRSYRMHFMVIEPEREAGDVQG